MHKSKIIRYVHFEKYGCKKIHKPLTIFEKNYFFRLSVIVIHQLLWAFKLKGEPKGTMQCLLAAWFTARDVDVLGGSKSARGELMMGTDKTEPNWQKCLFSSYTDCRTIYVMRNRPKKWDSDRKKLNIKTLDTRTWLWKHYILIGPYEQWFLI